MEGINKIYKIEINHIIDKINLKLKILINKIKKLQLNKVQTNIRAFLEQFINSPHLRNKFNKKNICSRINKFVRVNNISGFFCF